MQGKCFRQCSLLLLLPDFFLVVRKLIFEWIRDTGTGGSDFLIITLLPLLIFLFVLFSFPPSPFFLPQSIYYSMLKTTFSFLLLRKAVGYKSFQEWVGAEGGEEKKISRFAIEMRI